MSDEEKAIQSLETKFPTLSGSAFVAAREQVLASGQSVLQSENGFIYRVSPDGLKVLVKQVEPPTEVVSGTRYSIQ